MNPEPQEGSVLIEAVVQGYARLVDPWNDDETFSTTYKIEFRKWTVSKRTPKGMYLCLGDLYGLHTPPRWRSLTSLRSKRYCHTEEEALEDLLRRLRFRRQKHERTAKQIGHWISAVEQKLGREGSFPRSAPVFELI